MKRKKDRPSKVDPLEALKKGLGIIAEAGWPKPGTADGQVMFEYKHDLSGSLTGISVFITDAFLGKLWDELTSSDDG